MSSTKSSGAWTGRPLSSLQLHAGVPWHLVRAYSQSAITTSAAWKTATSPACSQQTRSLTPDPGSYKSVQITPRVDRVACQVSVEPRARDHCGTYAGKFCTGAGEE